MRSKAESNLQVHCVTWFKMQYRPSVAIIEASLNGAPMKPHHKKQMEREGMLIGTADLKIFHKGGVIHIELKAPPSLKLSKSTGKPIKKEGGRQSKEQKHIQETVESYGQPYYLCDSIEKFIKICKRHLQS